MVATLSLRRPTQVTVISKRQAGHAIAVISIWRTVFVRVATALRGLVVSEMSPDSPFALESQPPLLWGFCILVADKIFSI